MSTVVASSLKSERYRSFQKAITFHGLRRLAVMLAGLILITGFNSSAAAAAALPVLSVSASSDDGHIPANTLDGLMSTRWSASGDGQWIRYDLGASTVVGAIKIAWYGGDQRVFSFD